MTLLEEIKTVLRVTSAAFDEAELSPLIGACKADLVRVGVGPVNEEDPLTKQAIKLYCKANFGYADDSEKYRAAYEALRDAMSLFAPEGGGGGALS